jgi:transcriptional antiterminator NusG
MLTEHPLTVNPERDGLSGERTSLYVVKVTRGQERNIALMLSDRARVEKLPVAAILAPSELKGYLIVEADAPHTVEELIRGMKHVRQRVQGTLSISDVERYLESRRAAGVELGAVVEVVAGPFKGMQAKVMRVDEAKGEVTVELLEASYALPITLNLDYVREVKKT